MRMTPNYSYLFPGASIPPEAMMHSPPFQIPPYFQKIFRLCGKFPDKIFDFHPTKFVMTFFFFLSHQPQISNFPLFFLFCYISPLFCESYYFPLLSKFLPCFRKIHLVFTYFMCISFPPLL